MTPERLRELLLEDDQTSSPTLVARFAMDAVSYFTMEVWIEMCERAGSSIYASGVLARTLTDEELESLHARWQLERGG